MSDTRVVLVTGKGGVGKTTTAAATAARCAALGQRTLVMSTDPAHSLGDALGERLGDRPTDLGGGLAAQEIDARVRLEEQWGDLRDYLGHVLGWAGATGVEAEELTVLPGLGEVLALTDLVDRAGEGTWDTIVVDCAPTAETLRLLSLPEVLGWWIERLFPVGRQVSRLVGPMVERVTGLPSPTDAVFSAVETLAARMEAVRALLADPARTSVRLVVTPEQVVVAEARRTATYLSLYGFGVDAVVVNRLLPGELTDPWFDRWRAAQATLLASIEEGFAPVPVLRASLQPHEPVGRSHLLAFARSLYGRRDPSRAWSSPVPLRLARRGDGVVLTLALPFADRDDVDVKRRDDELVVTVGPHRRAVILPDSLAGRAIVDAVVDREVLEVVFGDHHRPAR